MAQWSRALGLSKDQSSFPSTYSRRLTTSLKSSSRNSNILFWPLWAPGYESGAQMYVQVKHPHAHKTKLKNNFLKKKNINSQISKKYFTVYIQYICICMSYICICHIYVYMTLNMLSEFIVLRSHKKSPIKNITKM